jgi:DNA-binding CsgD family transcriptional regulator
MTAEVTTTDVRLMGERLRREVYDAAMKWEPHRRDNVVVPFGFGVEQIHDGLRALEPTVRCSVWNRQPGLRYMPGTRMSELDQRSRRRGLELRFLTDGHPETRHPLLQSVEQGAARVTSADIQVLVTDEAHVVCEGPHTRSGEITAWRLIGPCLLEAGLRLMRECWATARPAELPATASRLLDARELQVADALCLGRDDRRIAHDLGISVRSVQRDVRTVLAHLGARTRSEAVARILGSPLPAPPEVPRGRPRRDPHGR